MASCPSRRVPPTAVTAASRSSVTPGRADVADPGAAGLAADESWAIADGTPAGYRSGPGARGGTTPLASSRWPPRMRAPGPVRLYGRPHRGGTMTATTTDLPAD